MGPKGWERAVPISSRPPGASLALALVSPLHPEEKAGKAFELGDERLNAQTTTPCKTGRMTPPSLLVGE